jgi:hypothetical protein
MARKQKTIHYLYKTTCLITGRWYIGMHSTCNLEDGYMGSGKRLRYSIRKYGKENHIKEILEFFESRELLIEAEKKAITEDMITDNDCMNLKSGGTGGFSSEEHRIKFSMCGNKAFKYKMLNDIDFKNRFSEIKKVDTKKRILNGNIKFWKDNYNWCGKKHSDKTKEKMSEAKKNACFGEKNSQYGTCWITKDSINKKIKKEDLETYLNDGWLKGKTVKSSIDESILLEIKKLKESGMSYSKLSIKFDIPKTTLIDNMKKNENNI